MTSRSPPVTGRALEVTDKATRDIVRDQVIADFPKGPTVWKALP